MNTVLGSLIGGDLRIAAAKPFSPLCFRNYISAFSPSNFGLLLLRPDISPDCLPINYRCANIFTIIPDNRNAHLHSEKELEI